MTPVPHPREILTPAALTRIRENAFVAENEKRLPQAVLDLIYHHRWFHVMVPKAYGGAELPLPETAQLFEALAWAEANTGWCVNLGAGANIFAGYFDQETAQELFGVEKTCCAGSAAITGTARRTHGGYVATGRWKYASGSSHATHFTTNCYLLNEDEQPLTKNGVQLFRSFIFPAEAVTIHPTWQSVGLQATSSNDFEVRNLFVPDHHMFSLTEPSAFAEGALYRFPFSQMAVVNMASMLTGIALHFIDLYSDLARHKKPLSSDVALQDNATAKTIVQGATASFYAARQAMFDTLEKVWRIYEVRHVPGEALLQRLSAAARNAAQTAREAVNDIYPLCGMSILNPASELNKVWRDAAAASQHFLISPLNI